MLKHTFDYHTLYIYEGEYPRIIVETKYSAMPDILIEETDNGYRTKLSTKATEPMNIDEYDHFLDAMIEVLDTAKKIETILNIIK